MLAFVPSEQELYYLSLSHSAGEIGPQYVYLNRILLPAPPQADTSSLPWRPGTVTLECGLLSLLVQSSSCGVGKASESNTWWDTFSAPHSAYRGTTGKKIWYVKWSLKLDDFSKWIKQCKKIKCVKKVTKKEALRKKREAWHNDQKCSSAWLYRLTLCIICKITGLHIYTTDGMFHSWVTFNASMLITGAGSKYFFGNTNHKML